MQAEKLYEYIWQDIRKKVYPDRIELYLPFFFGGNHDEPLCLTWDKNGVLSDGGRTLSELKKRLGDLTPYHDTIRRILGASGNVTLVGGQNLVVKIYVTCIFGEEQYLDYLGGLRYMLKAISLISVVDTIQVSEYGEVSI